MPVEVTNVFLTTFQCSVIDFLHTVVSFLFQQRSCRVTLSFIYFLKSKVTYDCVGDCLFYRMETRPTHARDLGYSQQTLDDVNTLTGMVWNRIAHITSV